MYNYLLVFLVAVLYAIDFGFQKRYQQKRGTGAKAGLVFNAGVGLCTAIIFLCINGFKIDFSPYAIFMATCMSACLLGYTILGFKVLKEGGMAFYTMFLMTGGMLVPYVWGVLFLDEKASMLRLLGVLIIIAAIVLSNWNFAKSSPKVIAYCVLIFFFNGGSSVVSKLCQTPSRYGVVNPTESVFWTGVTRFILCSLIILFSKFKETTEKEKSIGVKEVAVVIGGSAAVSGLGFMCQLIGAANLPATVLYPIISGGSIIFSTLVGRVCFKEKPSMQQKISVVLCFIGTCLFL